MKFRAITVVGIVLLVSSLGFAGTCAAPTVVPADGRIVDFDFVAAGTTNVYQVNVVAGHSYSLEVRQDYDGVNTDLSPATINQGTCAGAAEVTTDTHAIDPVMPANATRVSFIAAATGTDFVQVTHTNGAGTGRYISVSISETTLYSAGWTTAGNFATAWSLANTSTGTVTGDLTLFDGTGTKLAASHIVMASGGAALCYNSNKFGAINCPLALPGANKSGSAIFAHNGPPGSVVGGMFVQNFADYATPFTQPSDFKPARQGR